MRLMLLPRIALTHAAYTSSDFVDDEVPCGNMSAKCDVIVRRFTGNALHWAPLM